MANFRSTKIFGDLSVTGGIRINGVEVSENFKTGKVTATTNVTTDTINTLSTGNAIMRYHEGRVKLGSSLLPLQLDSNMDVVIKSGSINAIEIVDGGAYGRNFIMGAGGNMLIGAGESNTILKDNYSSSGENMVIGGDASVDIISNLQSGWGYRKILRWESGKLSFDSQLGNTPSIYRNNEGSIRVETSHGTTDIGMMNSGYSHFKTSAGSFYFNKSVAVSGDLHIGPSYNQKVATENWVSSNYDHRTYNGANNYLGGYYTSGGTEKPNNAIFGAGKLKLAMLGGSNLGVGGLYNDVLWLSGYSGGDVKGSHALIFDKYSTDIFVADVDYDATSWGTPVKLWHTGNDGSGSGLDADLLDGLHLNSTTRNTEVNRVMRTDASGYANFGWINTTSGNTESAVSDVYVNTGDGYIRKKTLALFKAELGSASATESGLVNTTTQTFAGSKTFNSTVNIGSGANLNFNSDKRMKNINSEISYSGVLNKLSNIKIYDYVFKKDELQNNKIGVMAQDVEDQFPEIKKLLIEDSGYNEEYDIQNQLSIKHDSLVYLLWMGLQEANEKIKKLEEMIYDGKNNS